MPAPPALQPRQAPRSLRRKAGALSEQINALAKHGYSLSEIRLALEDAGVQVSRSTVHREVKRAELALAAPVGSVGQTVSIGPLQTAAGSSAQHCEHGTEGDVHAQSNLETSGNQRVGLASDPRSAQQIAKDFMATHVSNPLFKRGSS